jgi:hypothetical protein
MALISTCTLLRYFWRLFSIFQLFLIHNSDLLALNILLSSLAVSGDRRIRIRDNYARIIFAHSSHFYRVVFENGSMEVVDNFTLADSVIGKHFLSIRLQPVETLILDAWTENQVQRVPGIELLRLYVWDGSSPIPVPPPLFKDSKIFS